MKLRQWQKVLLTVMVFTAIGILLVWAFIQGRKELPQEREKDPPIEAPWRVSAQSGEVVLTLRPDVLEKSGVVTSPLESASHQKERKAYGTVLSFDTIVGLRDRFAAAKAQLESTGASYAKSSKIYERRHEFSQERTHTWETLEGIEAAWRTDTANFISARAAFEVVKSQIRQQWGPVLAKWIFEASPQFNRLSSQEDVLIQVTLPSDVTIPSPPETALVDTSYGTKVSATFVSPSPRTDPRIQGQSFYYVAPARDVGMLPGMNVTAYLATGPQVQGVVIPSSAVVWLKGTAWVYVQKHTDRFVRQQVPVDDPVEGGFFVEKGLSPKERIVVKGAQLLLSEEFRSQIREEG